MNEFNLLDVWERLLKIGKKIIIGLFVAFAIHLACAILHWQGVIPMWAWVASTVPWGVLISLYLGVALGYKEISREFRENDKP